MNFPIHAKIKNIQEPDKVDSAFFKKNQNPGDILMGIDLVPAEYSQEIWQQRQRKTTEVRSTETFVLTGPIQITATSQQYQYLPTQPTHQPGYDPHFYQPSTFSLSQGFFSTPEKSVHPIVNSKETPWNDKANLATVSDLVKALQGHVDGDILEATMCTCGVTPSPSFSQFSEPNCDIYDPADLGTPPEDPLTPLPAVIPSTTANNNRSTEVIETCTTPLTTQSDVILPTENIASIHKLSTDEPFESYSTATPAPRDATSTPLKIPLLLQYQQWPKQQISKHWKTFLPRPTTQSLKP